MIKILGFRRVIILLALAALNGLLAAGYYLYMAPEQIKLERNLKSVRGLASSVQSDIAKLEVEFSQLEDQQAKFEDLRSDGFFEDQDRYELENALQMTQAESNVLLAKATVSAGEILEDENAQKSEHKILSSEITIDIEATNDLDIYKYLFLLEKNVPGHISIEEFNIVRDGDISGTVLRSIASGEEPTLVTAKVRFFWKTMIPQSLVDEREGGF